MKSEANKKNAVELLQRSHFFALLHYTIEQLCVMIFDTVPNARTSVMTEPDPSNSIPTWPTTTMQPSVYMHELYILSMSCNG